MKDMFNTPFAADTMKTLLRFEQNLTIEDFTEMFSEAVRKTHSQRFQMHSRGSLIYLAKQLTKAEKVVVAYYCSVFAITGEMPRKITTPTHPLNNPLITGSMIKQLVIMRNHMINFPNTAFGGLFPNEDREDMEIIFNQVGTNLLELFSILTEKAQTHMLMCLNQLADTGELPAPRQEPEPAPVLINQVNLIKVAKFEKLLTKESMVAIYGLAQRDTRWDRFTKASRYSLMHFLKNGTERQKLVDAIHHYIETGEMPA